MTDRIVDVDDLEAASPKPNDAEPDPQLGAPIEIERDAKGRPLLPDTPAAGNRAGLLAWITAVMALDPRHPVVSGRHLGAAGGAGMVELRRYDAPTLTFDPAGVIGKPDQLVEALTWQMIDTDAFAYGWVKGQAQTIARVVSLLCEAAAHSDLSADAATAVSTLIHTAEAIQGPTTYGTSGQRYEASRCIAPHVDDHGRIVQLRYLIEPATGELVMRVSDLARVARQLYGGLRRGWLDGAMEALGWGRVVLEGHELAGRDGRQGRHGRCDVYRGRLPAGDEEPVTT